MSDGPSHAATAADEVARAAVVPPAARRLRVALAAGVAGVLLVLAIFAYSLIDAQRQARRDVEHRFEDVALVSAALTKGILDASKSATVQQAMAQLGGPRVTRVQLDALARRSQAAYIEVLDSRGRPLGASSGAPPLSRPSPIVQRALRTGEATVGDVSGTGPQAVTEWAIPFPGKDGRRVEVTAIKLTALGAFLASFLGNVPNFAHAQSVVVDSRGVVLGGSDLKLPLGRPLPDRALLDAARHSPHGSYDSGRFFAASPIAGSTWRVAISTAESDLYASVNGSRRTVPWLLFAAFALTALAGLLLMRRSALAAAELQRKELSERHAVEINDNIIQGLALASYELERGERMAGSTQVGETLREAQRLVTELLGEGEVQPGQLRRETAARTDRPPQRPSEPGDGE
jgi:hypothetical protein